MQRFPEKLRTLREQHGMTQRMLADRLGFSQAYVYKLEHGQRRPNGELLLQLSLLFQVSTDVLLRDDLELPDG